MAFIGGSPGNVKPLLRFQGYLDAIEQHGIGADDQLVIGPAHTTTWCSAEDGYLAMKCLLALPCPPDAVFASTDYAAIGALRAMHERGIRVPHDIAIVGFDNVSISSITSPALTTVDQFVFAQGKAAGRLLLERIESAAPRRRAIEETFPCELVIRQSTTVHARVAA
jgi:LacI family transcriptional regulator